MRPLELAKPGGKLSVMCIGAHSDDIEIGAGGTIIELIERGVSLEVTWAVVSAIGARADEARASAASFLEGAAQSTVEIAGFRDGYFPYIGAEVKVWLEALKARSPAPDIVLTHWRDDAHQDHREISRLTWNTFRDHLVLEYEIPKWDGDIGRPNTYVPLSERTLQRKVDLLMRHFGTQRSKDWFDPRTFSGIARLRGMECRAPDGYAEAFHLRKAILL